jgi:hypothetical protein
MSTWLRRLLWLDVVVCSAFLAQLVFFPGHFLETSFGEHGASSAAALRDMTRLLAGIYASWTLILMWLTVVPSRALTALLFVSALVQLPIAWSLEAVTSSFRTTNLVMLSFWCVSYAALFVAWPRQ